VDDNVDAAEMLQFFLQIRGHQVELAYTASAALDAIKSSPPDVWLLNIGLPDSSGNDLATNIRSISSVQPVLLALTGFSTTQNRVRAREAGSDHYFVKPANLDALCAVLAEVSPRMVDR
jgi:DNA-binding response OmpR family regulator